MNKVILMGRLTRDPELSQTPTGTEMARFSIAVNRRFAKEGQQQADFINCTAWRQQAEFICKHFKQGSMIAVTGSIQTRSWDGEDGKKCYATDIVVDEVYFTGSKAESGTSGKSAPAESANMNNDPDFSSTPDSFSDDFPF